MADNAHYAGDKMIKSKILALSKGAASLSSSNLLASDPQTVVGSISPIQEVKKPKKKSKKAKTQNAAAAAAVPSEQPAASLQEEETPEGEDPQNYVSSSSMMVSKTSSEVASIPAQEGAA